MEAVYVGIDVSKESLDVVMRVGHKNGKARTYANSSKGIGELVKRMPKQAEASIRVCLEATGQYGDEVAETLQASGYGVSVINPVRSKRFAQADLMRTQNDQVDAGMLAEFCEVKQPRLWIPPSAVLKALRALSRRLEDLQNLLQMEKNRLKASKKLLPEVKSSLETVVAMLKDQIAIVKKQLYQTIQADPELLRQKRLIQSISGIGELTATRFLAELGDLREFEDAKQLAAFLGLTPECKTSGSSVHTKPHLSKKGPACVRHFLYMPAVSAKNHNPIVKAFAQRLKDAHKCDLSIISAVMHKLVHLMFGVVHSGKPFDPLYLEKSALAS